jgi:hypothetical protein
LAAVVVADSAAVDLEEDLAAPAVVAEVSVVEARAAVGRPKDLFVSIRSTQKLRWLRQ